MNDNNISLQDTKYEKSLHRISTDTKEINHFGYKTNSSATDSHSKPTGIPTRINIDNREVLCALLDGLQANNGATVSKHGSIITSGYSVSIMPHLEHIFDDSTTLTHPALQVSTWLNRLPKLEDDHCYGIWRDMETGKIYLDISIVFNHPETAESLGHWYKQKAVFDIAKQEAIWLT